MTGPSQPSVRAAGAASVVLGLAAILVAAACVRSLLLLRSLREHDADPGALAKILALSAALAVLSVVLLSCLRLAPDRRLEVALAVSVAAATLYTGELALRSWNDRGKLLVIRQMRAMRVEAFPAIPPSLFVRALGRSGGQAALPANGGGLVSLGGVANKETVLCRESDGWLVYTSDENGFHNPRGVWETRGADLVAVGDSFAAGSCVPSDRNMVALIRGRYPATVNLGYPGNGPLLMLAGLREYARALKPRRVLWCHFGNDLEELRREKAHPILRRYLEQGFDQRLLERRAEIDQALEAYFESSLAEAEEDESAPLRDLLGLRNLRARFGLAFADPYRFVPEEEDHRAFTAVLEAAKSTVEAWGGRLYFVYLPAYGEVGTLRQLGEDGGRGIAERERDRVLGEARALGLPLIDVRRAFASHPDPSSLFACPWCHYNQEGYRVAAEEVVSALISLGDGG